MQFLYCKKIICYASGSEKLKGYDAI